MKAVLYLRLRKYVSLHPDRTITGVVDLLLNGGLDAAGIPTVSHAEAVEEQRKRQVGAAEQLERLERLERLRKKAFG
jgi:hypothetical protein